MTQTPFKEIRDKNGPEITLGGCFDTAGVFAMYFNKVNIFGHYVNVYNAAYIVSSRTEWQERQCKYIGGRRKAEVAAEELQSGLDYQTEPFPPNNVYKTITFPQVRLWKSEKKRKCFSRLDYCL